MISIPSTWMSSCFTSSKFSLFPVSSNINSVLPLFEFSHFPTISMFSFSLSSISCTHLEDVKRTASSAQVIVEECFRHLLMSLIWRRNSSGPNIDPWGAAGNGGTLRWWIAQKCSYRLLTERYIATELSFNSATNTFTSFSTAAMITFVNFEVRLRLRAIITQWA